MNGLRIRTQLKRAGRQLILGMFCLLLVAPAMAVPVENLPAAEVSGGVGDEKQAALFKDAIAMWWTEYGVSKKLLHIHLFSRKLTPQERKTFVEKMEPMTDFDIYFNKKKGYDPVFSLPRVVLQLSYSTKPRSFSKAKPHYVSSSWYARTFMIGGGRSEDFKLGGFAKDGSVLTFSGTGGDRGSDAMHRYEWKVKGKAPLVIKN